jgi:hypothetical protein
MKQAIKRRRPKGDMMPEDDSEIMQTVVQGPIEAAEDAKLRYSEGEGSWLQEKYEILAVVYALGQYLKYNGTAWRKFISHGFFAYRKYPLRPIKDQPNALRHAMYFVLSATNESKRDRAGTYARGLKVLVRQNLRADVVASAIAKAGGIEKLAEAAKKDPTRPQKYTPPADPDYYDVSDEDEAKNQKDEVGERGGKALPAKGRSSNAASNAGKQTGGVEGDLDDDQQESVMVKYGRDPKGRPTVSLEVTPKLKKKLLGLKRKERMVIRIEGKGLDEAGDQEEWVRLRVRHAFQWPSARSKLMMH